MRRNTTLFPRALAAFLFTLIGFALFPASAAPLTKNEVLVLYNSEDPESLNLAEHYRSARNIPRDQVLGLKMPTTATISRLQYEQTIVEPLRDYFDVKNWWTRRRDQQGVFLPIENKIRAIVLMRGVPLRISPTADGTPTEGQDPISPRDEASVDSELTLFGAETLPTKGVLKNQFFQSDKPFSRTSFPFLVLTSRIDAPTYGLCKKIISDSLEAEKNGLWGRAYVDIANKFPEGDKWLEGIIEANKTMGIPTVIDRFNDTLPKNYPMTDASIYYGWYDRNVNGPFLNPSFQFRKGAVAVHLHSFSAEQLTDAHKNWAAPLIVRGAAATLGNVYEPYLQLTHQFDIFHKRLLDGWTFVEAAWASIPVVSWQGIAIGDPLYRPFLHINGTGEKNPEDRDFRALAAAFREWKNDPEKRTAKLTGAAEKLSSGNLAEAVALQYLETKDILKARQWLEKAKDFYPKKEDKLRQDFQLIAIDRAAKNTPTAIQGLRAAQEEYKTLPEAEALGAWLDILDPPPPPIVDPTKVPTQ